MVGDGRIHLPLALDAKAHRDFELTIHDLGSVDAAKHSKLHGAPTDVRTDLRRVGLHDTPQARVEIGGGSVRAGQQGLLDSLLA
ncbi:hypothetical protein ACIPY6_34640 [Streptomyces sp. NPDC090054]|uniref:hypothetical protein n=1 Tax=Streptomyces sp. NPDC090054 TaxID=3365933 RepID=UPI0037F2F2CF